MSFLQNLQIRIIKFSFPIKLSLYSLQYLYSVFKAIKINMSTITIESNPKKSGSKPPLPGNRNESKQLKGTKINAQDFQQDNIEYRDQETKQIAAETSTLKEQQILMVFDKYSPESDFDIEALRASPLVKIKRYKQCAYFGEFVNQMRHGIGIMLYHNGRVYQGNWQSNSKFGKGYEKFTNGSKYMGNYVNGKPQGYGTFIWTNGEIYQGQWGNGLKHGSGFWKGVKGDSYIGEWKYGKADGYGVHTWINGDRYEGEFKECLKHGEGTEKFSNGDIYVGNYINGKPCGYGQYFWTNGSIFKGYFKNGLRHGKGFWKKGEGNTDQYEGQYSNDKKCGYGIFTWQNGDIYKGNYYEDSRDGYGQMYWADGSTYKGNWLKGVQHGEGQIYLVGQQPKKGVFQQNKLIKVITQQIPQQISMKIKPLLSTKNFNTAVSIEKDSKILNNTNSFDASLIQKQSEIHNTKFKTLQNIRSRKLQPSFIKEKSISSNTTNIQHHLRQGSIQTKSRSKSFDRKSRNSNANQKNNNPTFYLHQLNYQQPLISITLDAQKKNSDLNKSLQKSKKIEIQSTKLLNQTNFQLNATTSSITSHHRIRRLPPSFKKKETGESAQSNSKIYIGALHNQK